MSDKPPSSGSTASRIDVRAFLGADKLDALLVRSDWYGAWAIAFNWALIGASFALVAWRSNALTISIALLVIGGRQLGLAILMHDCAHRTLFKSLRLNRGAGQWLCAAPVLADVEAYRKYHLKHHRTAGSDADPDRSNYAPYPVVAASFRRKMLRDVFGVTGVRNLLLIIKMNLGLIEYQLSYKQTQRDAQKDGVVALARRGVRNLLAPVLSNVVLFGVLFALGQPWLYALWVVAWLSPYMLFSRLRNAAEHAAVPDIDSLDPIDNTRTTHARWWERLTIAPNHVNYHLEHHLVPAVPAHRLAAFHAAMMAHPAYETCEVVDGYGAVVQRLIDRAA